MSNQYFFLLLLKSIFLVNQGNEADNTILSTYISDAQIAYNGSGIINDTAQPGVVTRVLNWLF